MFSTYMLKCVGMKFHKICSLCSNFKQKWNIDILTDKNKKRATLPITKIRQQAYAVLFYSEYSFYLTFIN